MLVGERPGKVIPSYRIVGIKADGLLEFLCGLPVVESVARDHAQRHVDIGELGINHTSALRKIFRTHLMGRSGLEITKVLGFHPGQPRERGSVVGIVA